jgi:conjugation system ATPase, traG family
VCRGHLIPKDIEDKEAVVKFLEALYPFERIINDSEQIRLSRMTEEKLVGTKEKGGLLPAV